MLLLYLLFKGLSLMIVNNINKSSISRIDYWKFSVNKMNSVWNSLYDGFRLAHIIATGEKWVSMQACVKKRIPKMHEKVQINRSFLFGIHPSGLRPLKGTSQGGDNAAHSRRQPKDWTPRSRVRNMISNHLGYPNVLTDRNVKNSIM